MTTTPEQWNEAEAQLKLSEMIDRAENNGPQIITRNGQAIAMVVSIKEWESRKKQSDSLAEFFASSPLRGSGLQIDRQG